jgi:tetratricopeptide (TPR) repeat protein
MSEFYSNLNIVKRLFTIILVLILTGCSNLHIDKEVASLDSGSKVPSGLSMVYPFQGTIFPPEFPAPEFEWKDSLSSSSKWNVFITDTKGNILISSSTNQPIWRPEGTIWERLKNIPNPGTYSFIAVSDKKVKNNYLSCKITFTFSKDSVGADIFFRAVTLPFSYAVKNVHTIEWYMGNVGGEKPRKMLDNLPVCANCHTFSTQEPILAMDVDYGNDKGSYVISNTTDTCRLKPGDIITWSNFKRDDSEPTYGLLSQISPDGKNVLSTVKDLSIFVAVDDNLAYSQLFFPIKGIIGIYNRDDNTYKALAGANDEKYVQSNPTWSPDGKKVIFAKTEAHVNEKVRASGRALLSSDDITEFTSGEKEFKYDLYVVDFNNGKGGNATPLPGASMNGKSNYFPKFSPDGKWIVFCQAENFMLLQPDSRLFIMPSEGGEPRLMNCNMEEMNSWHSWSPNGKWLVFSSKNRGPYTQLYLTHIDENGNDSPPVLLENLRFDDRAANIPEFFPHNQKHFNAIKDEFSKTAEYFNRGAFDKISNNYYKRALDDLQKAVKADSNYIETYFNRIMLNNILRQANSKEDLADKKKAMQLVLDSLSKKPDDENFLSLKITLLSSLGQTTDARNEALKAIRKHPNSYKLYDLLSTIYRKENRYNEALDCYKKMININPDRRVQLEKQMANALLKLNQADEALKIINLQLTKTPSDRELISIRAQLFVKKNNPDLAKKDIDFLLSKFPDNPSYHDLLAQLYVIQKNEGLYFAQKEKTISLLKEAYNINKEDIGNLFEIASHYMSIRDNQNAEEYYDLILKELPNNYEALKQKAKIKLTSQNWNNALLIYDILEEKYLPEEEFFNNKAIAYIQTGNFPKALEYFDKTLLLNPTNKDALFNRNRLRSEMGIKN